MNNMTPEQLMIPVDEQMPEFGTPVIGYNRQWIDEDFNHRGLRECFIYGDGTQWHTAKWVYGPDCYETTDDDKPTHWAPMLNSAALSANGGEVTENGMGGHYDSRFGFIRNDGAGVLYATCPECGSVSGQCEEGCPENGSPSVAAPEGFLVKRSPDYIRIIRTKDMGCAAYSKTSDLATEILAWHFLDALLSAAPQPQAEDLTNETLKAVEGVLATAITNGDISACSKSRAAAARGLGVSDELAHDSGLGEIKDTHFYDKCDLCESVLMMTTTEYKQDREDVLYWICTNEDCDFVDCRTEKHDEINWDEAPEGAQRYRKSLPSPWLKKDAAGVVCYFHELRRIWCRYPHGIGEEPFNGATPRPVDTCPDCGETGGHTERCNDQHMPLFQTEQGEEIERLKAEIERLRNAEREAYARTAKACRAYASHAHDEGRRDAYTLIAVDCERIAASIDGAASKGEG